ncbi:MAG: thermonuclease family protein [Armatimonadota bacterium]|nr:thermonuclease family protein [Armatimonadota bacterium]MDR5696159.1 thermonuclease family protein [Armatimonadota bacterium]
MNRLSARRWLRLSTLGLLVLSLGPAPVRTACTMPPQPDGLVAARVMRIVDGDTVRVALYGGGSWPLRLLGIDTPEVFQSEKLDRDARDSGRSKEAIQALGRLSSRYTRMHLDAKDVGLEFDVQRWDRFGRLLAHVWLSDGRLFNLQIVRDGYAQVLTIPPNVKYADLLLACQQEARRHNRGLWGR